MDIITTPKPSADEIKQKIADLVATGLDPEKDKLKIAESIGLPIEEIKEIFMKDRQERLIKKAELTSDELLSLDLNDKDLEHKFGKAKIQLLKLKQAESQFIRETLGKDVGYSKRSEITGKNGEEVRIKEIIFNAPIMPASSAHEKNNSSGV